MTQISERYRKRSQEFADTVAAVPEDRWSNPSPCEEWTARDVVRHVVQTPGMFFGLIGAEYPEPPSVDDDPDAAVTAARETMQRALDDPEVASTEFDGFFGRTSFEQAVDRFVNFDLVVHRWDLARATGLDETMPAEEIPRLADEVAGYGDAARSPGVFGPVVDVPPDADPQTALLGQLGRRP
jgi:uncharacterized protein (TIGR03086 family)